MVYAEADWGTDYPLIFYANTAGTVIVDAATGTGADGDSWTPMAAQLATVMMPGNPHVAVWQNAVARDAIDAWARPSDDANTTTVNGATVATWIGNQGSNVLAAGDLINHSRIAPDYSSLIYQNMQDVLMAGFAGKPAPQAITALLGPLYASYTGTNFASPPYLSPGGTVYTSGSAKIFYPQGIDWGPIQYLPYALADAQTAVFGAVADPSANATWQNLHASAELALQTRAGHTDGHTYDSDTEYRYVGREEHVAQLAAQYYSTLYLRDNNLVPATDTSSLWMAP
jgi:hypothetical protein